MALQDWLRPLDDHGRSHLTSVKLKSRGVWPERLVNFSSHGWHSFTRVGAPNPYWAHMANHIIRPHWIDVPLTLSTGLTDTAKQLHPRNQYRKAAPATKTYALAAALRSSATAIASKRGGGS